MPPMLVEKQLISRAKSRDKSSPKFLVGENISLHNSNHNLVRNPIYHESHPMFLTGLPRIAFVDYGKKHSPHLAAIML